MFPGGRKGLHFRKDGLQDFLLGLITQTCGCLRVTFPVIIFVLFLAYHLILAFFEPNAFVDALITRLEISCSYRIYRGAQFLNVSFDFDTSNCHHRPVAGNVGTCTLVSLLSTLHRGWQFYLTMTIYHKQSSLDWSWQAPQSGWLNTELSFCSLQPGPKLEMSVCALVKCERHRYYIFGKIWRRRIYFYHNIAYFSISPD